MARDAYVVTIPCGRYGSYRGRNRPVRYGVHACRGPYKASAVILTTGKVQRCADPVVFLLSCSAGVHCCMLYWVIASMRPDVALHWVGIEKESALRMGEHQDQYQIFRERLDAVLRERAPDRLREFLIAEGQWPENTTTDTEAALWMMIATSPALTDQHQEARVWLISHGHEAEARAIFGEKSSVVGEAGTRHRSSHRRSSRQKRS